MYTILNIEQILLKNIYETINENVCVKLVECKKNNDTILL